MNKGLLVFIGLWCAFLIFSPFNSFANSPQEKKSASSCGEAELLGLQEKANSGDAESQFQLGCLYENGEGVHQDYAEGFKWYKKGADQGFVNAITKVGDFYFNGIGGLKKDPVMAVKWWRKAAELGNAGAQSSLGYSYALGIGIPKDYVEAVKWYRKAAEQGNAVGQKILGSFYEAGIGVPKDYVEAVKWYRKAAEQGDKSAKNDLAALEAAMKEKAHTDKAIEAKRNDGQDWQYLFPPDGTISKYNLTSRDSPDGTQTKESVFHYLPNNVIVEYSTLYDSSGHKAPAGFEGPLNSKIKYILENNQVFRLMPNGKKVKHFEKVEIGKDHRGSSINIIYKSITLGGKKYQDCFGDEWKYHGSEGGKSVFCKNLGMVYDVDGVLGTSSTLESSKKAKDDELGAFKARFMKEWEW